ncbi:sensor histidine kinase [Massilia pseudoviolaceinigra]|uniref:sensor histidine kinase n=1 Tax=Massilia pseudoviolaceinigra TaxID=3057165 RepID=UPI002796E155|nr:histidine kinase [Massilia sp. CCM 9206]MDQ1919942.1 histidine kinase [Massilia sp. CCM 9206]
MVIADSPLDKDAAGTVAQWDVAYSQLVARIRLVLTVSAVLVAVLDHPGPDRANLTALLVLSVYASLCAAVYLFPQCQPRWTRGKLRHRLDVAVSAAVVAAVGPAEIFPLVFLLFAIVVASLRYGLAEGVRVTIATVLLYYMAAIITLPDVTPARLLLRAAVLLAFGRVIAQLGEMHILAARRQALLRELSQVANPRFGIDRSMTAALDRVRAFFMADSCLLLLGEHDSGGHALRTVRAHGPTVAPVDPIDPALARAMLPEPHTQVLLFTRAWRCWRAVGGCALAHGGEPPAWAPHHPARLEEVADLLGATSFISAPVSFGRGKGRIYVATRMRHLGRGDALFLARIAEQGLRAIDRIDLLDRIASDAAGLERKKIALDLHDTAIQSYIGLQLGLVALCRKAEPSNPLAPDLDKLVTMAAEVIAQLRDEAQRACGAAPADDAMFLAALRRQAARALATYGVEIGIDVGANVTLGDRLGAEVLQIVREGISNVCRHTDATAASVALRCSGAMLHIDISNPHGGSAPPAFQPRSLSERASALGGAASVRQGSANDTIVTVEIPL